uniref:PSP domain-containing protein n=1 Tax=Schistocephalus solidus TaxID=70667 RepID=A0A183SAR3_SCHSO
LYDAKEEAGEIKRYHEIEKFSLYKPGKISSELRRALNLGKHDIPIHVYRMRSLGYPPGWLNKARVEDLPSFNEEKAERQVLLIIRMMIIYLERERGIRFILTYHSKFSA